MTAVRGERDRDRHMMRIAATEVNHWPSLKLLTRSGRTGILRDLCNRAWAGAGRGSNGQAGSAQ